MIEDNSGNESPKRLVSEKAERWLKAIAIGAILGLVVLAFQMKGASYDTLYLDLEAAVGSSREEVRAQFGEPDRVITIDEYLALPAGTPVIAGFSDPEMRGFQTIEIYGSDDDLRDNRKRAIYLYFDESGRAVFCDKGKASGWLDFGTEILYQEDKQ